MTMPRSVMPIDNVFGYPVPVWQRFVAPSLGGALDLPTVQHVSAQNSAAHAQIDLYVVWAPQRQVRFCAIGCPVTVAVGQWLAEQILQNGHAALAQLDAAAIRAALEIPEDRTHCALLGEDVVRSLLMEVTS